MANQNEKPKVLTKKHVARQERERRQVMIVRTVAIVMTVVVVLLLVYGYLDTNYLQKQKPAANVNGEKIAIAELQERIQLQRLNLVNTIQQYQFFQEQFGMDYSQQIQQIQYYLQVPEAFGQVVLDQMVEETLIRQEAEKRGITASEEELDQAIQNAYGFYANGTPIPTITPTPFEYPTLTSKQLTYYPPTATPTTAPTSTAAPTSTPDLSATPTATFTAAPPTPTFVPEDVTATATPYTLEGFQTQFSKSLEQYKAYGISEKTIRSVYRNDLLRKKLQDEITTDEATSDEQVWARHILVDTEAEAKALYSLLKNGSDFDSLAKEYSKDTGSGLQGGDLGWFGRGMMVSEFEDAAFSLPIGEISEPVQTQFGYHIVQVLDRRDQPLSESQLQQKRDTAFTEWLASIKENALIAQFETWKEQIPPMPDFSSQAQ